MNRPAPHPVELAIVAALAVIEALMTLVIAAAALVVTRKTIDDWMEDFSESPDSGLSEFPPGFEPPIYNVWTDGFIDLLQENNPIIPAGFEPPIYNVWKQQARPTAHPLALLADQLEALPAATLRQLAGVRSRRHNKAALVAMVAACS